MEIKNTKEFNTEGKVNILIYGGAGAGKTTLSKTLSNAIIFSAESGLLSLAGSNCDYVEIKSIQDLIEAFEYVTSNEDYQTIVIDSLSEIGEIILEEKKGMVKDDRKAYLETQISITKLIKVFRDCNKNIIFLCKEEKSKVEDKLLYSLALPGQKLASSVPYLLDIVMRLIVTVDEEGNPMRVLQTFADDYSYGKDRSGKLESYEEPDLGLIMRKIIDDTPF